MSHYSIRLGAKSTFMVKPSLAVSHLNYDQRSTTNKQRTISYGDSVCLSTKMFTGNASPQRSTICPRVNNALSANGSLDFFRPNDVSTVIPNVRHPYAPNAKQQPKPTTTSSLVEELVAGLKPYSNHWKPSPAATTSPPGSTTPYPSILKTFLTK